MWNAALIMTNRFKLNSRAYEIVRKEYSKEFSKNRTGANNFYFNKGHLLSGNKNPNYKGTTIAKNISTGVCQMFNTEKELRAAGFDQGTVSKCISGKRNKHMNHTFTRVNLNANEKSTTPLPTGTNSQSNPSEEHGAVPTTGTREDSYDLDHYQRAVCGEDADYRTQTRGGDSVGYRMQKVEPPSPVTRIEDHGQSEPEIVRLDFSSRYLSDKP
jgi:hypothetical protein